MFGALAYLLALPIEFRSPRFTLTGRQMLLTGRQMLTMPEHPYRALFNRRVIVVTFLSTVGLLASFVIMGYVPLFAADPLQAKYFRGEYREGFLRASFILRPCLFALIAYLPLAIVVAATKRRLRYFFLILAG